jgi:membrane protease YdiL (CAAX protease family)
MFTSMLRKIQIHLVATVAAAVCVAVAVVAMGIAVYEGLSLVVSPIAASALTALIFLLLAGVALLFLRNEQRKLAMKEAAQRDGIINWSRLAPVASEVGLAIAAILTERARRRREERGRDKR